MRLQSPEHEAVGDKMVKNREIEVKLPVRDIEKVRADLKKLGARKMTCVYERNALFDTEDFRLRQRHAILRIRCEQNARFGARSRATPERDRMVTDCLLTFKGLLKDGSARGGKYKEREEIECSVTEARQLARILEGLGLHPWFRYEKYRTKYAAADNELHFDLDETPIGAFLELEGPKRSINRAARALGYSVHDYITASYLELYRAECARSGRKVANMVFAAKKKR